MNVALTGHNYISLNIYEFYGHIIDEIVSRNITLTYLAGGRLLSASFVNSRLPRCMMIHPNISNLISSFSLYPQIIDNCN